MPASHADGSPPGRPLHPPLVHAPLGAVVIAAVCDLVSLIGGASHDWAHTWFRAGSDVLIVGTALLLLAALAGFADRARRTAAGSADRAAVDRHAVVMSLMGVACIVDVVLRSTRYDGAQHTPAVVLGLTLAALGLATVGGELGGRLVYRAGVGVHRAPAVTAPTGDAAAIGPGARPTTRAG